MVAHLNVGLVNWPVGKSLSSTSLQEVGRAETGPFGPKGPSVALSLAIPNTPGATGLTSYPGFHVQPSPCVARRDRPQLTFNLAVKPSSASLHDFQITNGLREIGLYMGLLLSNSLEESLGDIF